MENISSSKLFTTRQGTILLGVIAAVIAAIALLVFLNQYRSGANSTVQVLVAKKTIPQGTSGDVLAQVDRLLHGGADSEGQCPERRHHRQLHALGQGGAGGHQSQLAADGSPVRPRDGRGA